MPTPKHWASIHGDLEFTNEVIFQGKRREWKTDSGDIHTDVSYGLAITDVGFSGGDISAEISLRNVGAWQCAEIVIFYDPVQRTHVNVGIRGEQAFIIRHWDGKQWHYHAAAGSRYSLRPDCIYRLLAKVRGSRVSLSVNDVTVIETVLPFPLSTSQVGMFYASDSLIKTSNFQVDPQKGLVFVIMQFSSPFNELYEEVISKVCEPFNLKAHRADQTFGPGMIIADIVRDIADSMFIIAEITPPNRNVYYELGYAHGINKPAILMADKRMEKLPFDVSPYRVLFYDDSIIGRRQFEEGLRKHIAAILEKGRLPIGVGLSDESSKAPRNGCLS
jgi:hypothetical protein